MYWYLHSQQSLSSKLVLRLLPTRQQHKAPSLPLLELSVQQLLLPLHPLQRLPQYRWQLWLMIPSAKRALQPKLVLQRPSGQSKLPRQRVAVTEKP